MEGFLEWFLESSLLVLMILGIRKAFMGKVRYAGIYALWIVVLVRFMVPVNLISTPFSAGNMISRMVSSWTLPDAGQDNQKSGAPGERLQQERGTGEVFNLDSVGIVSGKNQQMNAAGHQKQYGFILEESKQKQTGAFAWFMKINWKLYLGTIWLVISVILFLWFFLSNFLMMRKLKRNRVFYGFRKKIKIYTVTGIKNPCLYGFLRPVIYIPEALVIENNSMCVEEEELEQIIMHEYVHYQHGDNIWAMLRMFLASVYWFDPFIWLAISRSRKDAELFCDETVIRQLGERNRFKYGRLLVKMAGEVSFGDFRYSMILMSRKGKEMEKRIRAITEKRHYARWILIPLVMIVFAAMGITCSAGLNSFAKSEKGIKQAEAEARTDLKDKSGKELSDVNQVLERQAVNPQEWLNGFDQLSMNTFYASSYIGKKAGEELPGALVLRNDLKDSHVDIWEEKMESAVYSSNYEEAFENYLEIFIDAVNTGNVEKMHLVLAADSEVYKQQRDLAKNYHKRGIREKLKGFSISLSSNMGETEPGQEDLSLQIAIDSKEVIKVFYADGSAKTVRQKYRYTCECIDENWVITNMEEISE